MDCVQCSRPVKGNSSYCSASCRASYSRNKRNTEAQRATPQSATNTGAAQRATPASATSHTAGLQHYYDNPDKYIQRAEPDKLNWGPWVDNTGLKLMGLKANRVAIPGDHDYR